MFLSWESRTGHSTLDPASLDLLFVAVRKKCRLAAILRINLGHVTYLQILMKLMIIEYLCTQYFVGIVRQLMGMSSF